MKIKNVEVVSKQQIKLLSKNNPVEFAPYERIATSETDAGDL